MDMLMWSYYQQDRESHKRSHLMTKYTKLSLFLAVSLFAGSILAAERGPRHDRMQHRSGEMGTQVIEHLGKAVRRLDLSEEQKESIHADIKGLKESIRPLVKELHQGRKELHGLITGTEYDAEAVAAIADKQGSLTAEITRVASGTAAAVLAQLTDEQRAELVAMGEARQAHREKHRGKMKARTGERHGKGSQDAPEDS
jgi:Spy/CpxP family protein refolding chaperone